MPTRALLHRQRYANLSMPSSMPRQLYTFARANHILSPPICWGQGTEGVPGLNRREAAAAAALMNMYLAPVVHSRAPTPPLPQPWADAASQRLPRQGGAAASRGPRAESPPLGRAGAARGSSSSSHRHRSSGKTSDDSGRRPSSSGRGLPPMSARLLSSSVAALGRSEGSDSLEAALRVGSVLSHMGTLDAAGQNGERAHEGHARRHQRRKRPHVRGFLPRHIFTPPLSQRAPPPRPPPSLPPHVLSSFPLQRALPEVPPPKPTRASRRAAVGLGRAAATAPTAAAGAWGTRRCGGGGAAAGREMAGRRRAR